MTENRIRVNAKSTSKGIWSLDVTVEYSKVIVSGEEISGADVNVLSIIKEQEKQFKADGRKLAGDNDE